MTKAIINEEWLSVLSENEKQTKWINHKITINTITPTTRLEIEVGDLQHWHTMNTITTTITATTTTTTAMSKKKQSNEICAECQFTSNEMTETQPLQIIQCDRHEWSFSQLILLTSRRYSSQVAVCIYACTCCVLNEASTTEPTRKKPMR